MENEEIKFKELLKKYESGLCSPEEVAWLDSWYLQLNEEKKKFLSQSELDQDRPMIWQFVNDQTKPVSKLFQWPRIGVAAAVATVIISAGIWFYQAGQKEVAPQVTAFANDVAPGKQGATLTLASGKKIRLADAVNGELAKEAGVTITKTADGELVYQIENSTSENKINTIATANGETYQVRLPDGSAVWLNAGSSLTYSANLIQDGKRGVRLSGEGYFEIAKDKAHPFVVTTDRESVEVLGTHFNVSSYANDPLSRTTLQEGSIRLNAKTVLVPGEQAMIGSNGNMRIEEVNVNKAIAWKNGKFVFADEDIESIMRKLARWYDVEVVYEGEKPTESFTASISRFDYIGRILNKLAFTKNVHFKIEGRRITVMK